jgi:tubulin polyglutamylase TTLL6/13
MTKKLDDVPKDKIFVVQQYLKNPCLINQYKFDLRIYVLVTSCDPLSVFIYKDGLARFATEKYKPVNNPNKKKNNYMHLTNYAINKRNKNYCEGGEEDDEEAHKRSIISVFKSLKENIGADIDEIWTGIKEIIIKTLLGVQPELSHIYKACQPRDKLGTM